MLNLALVILASILVVVAFISTAYFLSLFDICFTQIREGSAKAVMKGGSFDHLLMHWRGHYLHDPRRSFYDPAFPAWEVYASGDPYYSPSSYALWQIHWRLLESIGIYWFGLYPFKQIYRYEFKWSEQTLDEAGHPKPWQRDEYTDFVFVKNFTYWIKLQAAEDEDNEPLDLDYLLTVHVNNPYKALFGIDDWLGRTTADANNHAKIYVGCHTFDVIKRESLEHDATTSEFASGMLTLTNNIVTEPGIHGSALSYGITIMAASLVDANPAGVSKDEIVKSFSAKIVAQRNADAAVATAKGEGDAARERAKGQADATRELAKGNADAIETVYRKVGEFGENGVVLQGLDAIRQASTSPGSTVIWANNPLGGLVDALRSFTARDTRTAPPPAS